MSKKATLLLAGATVIGLLWWKFGCHDKREVEQAVRTVRKNVVILGTCMADGLEHLAATIEDVRKIVHTVARTVDQGLDRVA